MTNILVLPLVIPLATAILAMIFRRSIEWQRRISLTGAAALLLSSILILLNTSRRGILVLQIANWQAPFGISFVVDLFSAIMVTLTGILGLAVAVYSLGSIDRGREAFGFHALYHLLLMGVNGAFLTGDIFNLYVWFEVMLMSSFVLLALGGRRKQVEGAVVYVTINLISSALFLAAVGLLYGMVGTLNMADIARKLQLLSPPQTYPILTSIAMLFLVAFGIKSAVFPLFFWLPASYHTPPPAVSALFAGLLTKVGVYSLIRVFTLIFIQNISFTHTLILVIAGLTMVTGVLGAIAQNEFRRILSFHIISQIGYMIMGLALFTPLALAGSVFYIAHHIIVKTNLFLFGGYVEHLRGTGKLTLLGGLYRRRWGLSLLFLIPSLSLAGIPPLSGFFAKLSLVQAGIQGQQFVIVAVSLGVSLLTLFSMTKIWNEAFWKPLPETRETDELALPSDEAAARKTWVTWLMPIGVLAAITVFIGLGAGSVFSLALRAGDQLMDPGGYIRAVLGGT